MADLSHPEQLPTIARLLDDRFNIARSWIEPRCVSGEIPDVFSVVDRGGSWYGGEHYYGGQTVVSEFKSSVADLRADAYKPFRSGQLRGLGDFRLYWLRKGGKVRTEHVDEACGFGVVMFDGHGAELVRPPQRFHGVNTWAQTALLVKLMSKEARRGTDAKRGKTTRHAAGKYVGEAVKLLEQGPLTTGQLRKLIAYPESANKLAAELSRCDRVSQDGVGGNWTIAQ